MKNKKYIVLIILLLLTVVTSYIVTGTYAKYTSSVTGEDSATVAKWAWQINSQDVNLGGKTFTMNLFDNTNVYDLDESGNCGTVKDADVKEDTSILIAPGTCGKFAITLTNKSEVKAHYSYALSTVNESNIPVEFSKDNKTWGSIDSIVLNGDLNVGTSNTAETIYWRWKFEGNDDVKDTGFGTLETAPTVKVTADLTLTQID